MFRPQIRPCARFPLGVVLLLSALLSAPPAFAQEAGEAQWIWSPAYNNTAPPAGAVFFRKVNPIDNPESAR